MTRPQIVRADTIDLQDQTSPSAQDHSHRPLGSPLGIGPAAPHQASELRHVQDERAAEEENLSHAWNVANHVGLSDEPPSDDDADVYMNGSQSLHPDQQAVQHNGVHSATAAEDGADAEGADPEGEDSLDDDTMDKISSSPSIDDGVYTVPVYPDLGSSNKPGRWTSAIGARPATPLRPSPLDSDALDSPGFPESDGSSPFAETPTHLPLKRWNTQSMPYRPDSPYIGRRPAGSRPNSPYAGDEDSSSSSPFTSSPTHFPLILAQNPRTSSRDHHRTGEFATPRITIDPPDEGFGDEIDPRRDSVSPPPWKGPPRDPSGDGAAMEVASNPCSLLAPDLQLVKSASDIALDNELLPVYDPLLEDEDTARFLTKRRPSPGPGDDDDWETETEDSFYNNDDCSEFSINFYGTDDDPEDLPSDSRFIDSGWGGECLRETEDIDFEFVYALHTFVATVEGQANATKGDTMVLLDDSNSYWWLVRIVKDSTIGYLPAEHIETPTERLARLNKHRNIDLSATMLGDTTEKSKNPLKKAMRRRNAKTVTFGGLNYVEASDYEFSSDEEDGSDKVYINGEIPPAEESDGGAVQEPNDEDIAVAPLTIAAVKKDARSPSPEKRDPVEQPAENEPRRKGVDQDRTSDETFNRQFENQGPKKTRNGNIRNTDSFFKDESVETRKITLTPNLLRDDSSASTLRSDAKSRGSSFESIDREAQKAKDDKKKKEKKSGMLSGMFKRNKEKKAKRNDGAESPQKGSEEISRDSASIASRETSPTVEKGSVDSGLTGPTVQRKPSNGKLQKARPGLQSPTSATQKDGLRPLILESEAASPADSRSSTPAGASPEKHAQAESPQVGKPSLHIQTSQTASNGSSSIANTRSPTDGLTPEKVRKAKTREALDVDSSPDVEKSPIPPADAAREQSRDEGAKSVDEAQERLSESPVHITAADAQPENEPPTLVGDNSSNSSTDELTSLRSSPSPPVATAQASSGHARLEPSSGSATEPMAASHSPTSPVSPHTVIAQFAARKSQSPQPPTLSAPPPPTRSPPPQPGTFPSSPLLAVAGNKTPTSPPPRNNSASTTASTATSAWSDANLRHYLDSTGTDEIRDLLLVVHDTTGVVPVGPEHELIRNLFVEERGKVKDLGLELDGLLTGWLARKRDRAGKRTPLGMTGGGGRG